MAIYKSSLAVHFAFFPPPLRRGTKGVGIFRFYFQDFLHDSKADSSKADIAKEKSSVASLAKAKSNNANFAIIPTP